MANQTDNQTSVDGEEENANVKPKAKKGRPRKIVESDENPKNAAANNEKPKRTTKKAVQKVPRAPKATPSPAKRGRKAKKVDERGKRSEIIFTLE